MKRDSLILAVLTTSALVLAVAWFAWRGGSTPARADMLSTNGDYTLITESPSRSIADQLTVIDNRHGLVLFYRLMNNQIVLENYVNLLGRFNPQPLR
ncbi:MAG: hypothetical protein HKL96_09515 [Phycisphaerales bacterium]|nr:hypothetical protein [Phycisphaerales bacterium]